MGLRQPSFARGHMYGRKSVSNGAASKALKDRGLSKGPACSTLSLWWPSPSQQQRHCSPGWLTCQIPRMAVHSKRNKHEEEKSHHTSQLLNVWERVSRVPWALCLVSVAYRCSSWVSAGRKSFRGMTGEEKSCRDDWWREAAFWLSNRCPPPSKTSSILGIWLPELLHWLVSAIILKSEQVSYRLANIAGYSFLLGFCG